MTISYEPRTRLAHLDEYISKVHLNLPLEEAKIQLLRCRLTGYKLVAEIGDEKYTKEYVDNLIGKAYENLSKGRSEKIIDPYADPCASQYSFLEELKSYTYWDKESPLLALIKVEFKKVFIPTLRLLTELCRSENKYTWEEVKTQLQQIMDELGVDITWEQCDTYMEKYLEKVSDLIGFR
jgi:hypothetical protein